jgi:CRP/FNR family transcriptional regulator, anaerobic regulatory protein
MATRFSHRLYIAICLILFHLARMVAQLLSFPTRSVPVPPRTGLRSLLSPEDLLALDSIAQRQNHESGRYVYQEGDPSTHAYTVESGLLMLERIASDGARQVLAFVFPGDMIGLGLDGKQLVSAKVLKTATLSRYPLSRFPELVAQHPDIEKGIRYITNRILAYTLDQLCVLGRMTARERVVYFLLHLAEREGKPHTAPLRIDVPMTRVDMADFLGLTVETVSRTLSQLKREGSIRLLEGHQIELPNLDKIDAIAERFRHG